MIIKLLPLLISFMLVACDSRDTSAFSESSVAAVDLGTRDFTMTSRAAENIVIRDPAALSALWHERMVGITPTAPVPTVNFNQHMVIGIFLGAYPNSCYSIAIANVEQKGEQTKVTYQVNPPGLDEICAQTIVYPLKLIAVPKKSGEVLFIDISKK